MLRDPVTINLERKSAPPVGITQAVYPVARELKSALLVELLKRDIIADAIVFTRTKHRANRLAEFIERHGISSAEIHGNRSQGQRTAALAGFKSGDHRVLVATDIVARGIDVEDLGHVVNFDVPADPDAYIHRVGRTARAEATGDAFTLVSPDEEADLRAIERALGRSLPRVTLADFDYARKTDRAPRDSRARAAGRRARRPRPSPRRAEALEPFRRSVTGGRAAPRRAARQHVAVPGDSGQARAGRIAAGRRRAEAGRAAARLNRRPRFGIAAGWRALAGRAASEQPAPTAWKPTSGWAGFPRRRAAARAMALAQGGCRDLETGPERGRFPGVRRRRGR